MVRHGLGRRVGALLLVLLASGAAGGVPDTELDVPYGSDPAQRLDLTVPGGAGFPTLIMVHGGSLTDGDKADADYRMACKPFPPAGVACANVNYRLAPAHKWPAQAEDVAAAVAWVRVNIVARGGDPQALFLMGHSSGALLAALFGCQVRHS